MIRLQIYALVTQTFSSQGDLKQHPMQHFVLNCNPYGVWMELGKSELLGTLSRH